ncbi:uncharacterized protein G2W53_018653 [Senna tora]|uniref:Uncharacterized protein n=1 Tax=Senna tora TaxID=362788 RepID=A0A834U0V8_9FABA|nr:uncharacterized protein G2W53_018653 [Senna tora]
MRFLTLQSQRSFTALPTRHTRIVEDFVFRELRLFWIPFPTLIIPVSCKDSSEVEAKGKILEAWWPENQSVQIKGARAGLPLPLSAIDSAKVP